MGVSVNRHWKSCFVPYRKLTQELVKVHRVKDSGILNPKLNIYSKQLPWILRGNRGRGKRKSVRARGGGWLKEMGFSLDTSTCAQLCLWTAAHMNSQQWKLHTQTCTSSKVQDLIPNWCGEADTKSHPCLSGLWQLRNSGIKSKFSLKVKPLMGWLSSSENYKFKNIWEWINIHYMKLFKN